MVDAHFVRRQEVSAVGKHRIDGFGNVEVEIEATSMVYFEAQKC